MKLFFNWVVHYYFNKIEKVVNKATVLFLSKLGESYARFS